MRIMTSIRSIFIRRVAAATTGRRCPSILRPASSIFPLGTDPWSTPQPETAEPGKGNGLHARQGRPQARHDALHRSRASRETCWPSRSARGMGPRSSQIRLAPRRAVAELAAAARPLQETSSFKSSTMAGSAPTAPTKAEKLFEIIVGRTGMAPPITYEAGGKQYVAFQGGLGPRRNHRRSQRRQDRLASNPLRLRTRRQSRNAQVCSGSVKPLQNQPAPRRDLPPHRNCRTNWPLKPKISTARTRCVCERSKSHAR